MSYVFQVPDDIYSELAAYASQHGQTPDALLMALVREAVEQLKQGEVITPVQKTPYDPLAPFIGAFDSGGDDPGWIERHDDYFANGIKHHTDNNTSPSSISAVSRSST